MRKVIDWLDAAKAVTGSDYATAKALGISRQHVSHFRSGRQLPSVKVCGKMAELVGVSPLEIIASCEVQKDPAEEKRWAKWLGAAAILSCVIMADSLFNSTAYGAELKGLDYTLCAVIAVAACAYLMLICYRFPMDNGAIQGR